VNFFVGEDRVQAAAHIMSEEPGTKTLILDDAFQHRKFKGTLNILLSTWHRPYVDDCLVPCGRLRDLKSRASKAQVVIVTKCPRNATIHPAEWRTRLNLLDTQSLFFTSYKASKPVELTPRFTGRKVKIPKDAPIVVITGIADGKHFVKHMEAVHTNVQVSAFKDHHAFNSQEIASTLSKFTNFAHGQKWIMTTEKDAVRLLPFLEQIHKAGVKVAMLPIEVEFVHGEEQFKKVLNTYVE